MNITTYYSILQCLLSPDKAVKACAEAGYDKLILCDNNLSAVVEFYEECKKNKVKPVFGLSIKVCELPATDMGEHNVMHDLYLIAKNKTGYKNLLKIVSKSNQLDHTLETKYQRIPRIHLSEFNGLTDGIAAIIGCEGTELHRYHNSQTEIDYVVSKYENIFGTVLYNGTLESKSIAWSNVRYITEDEQEDFHVILSVLLKCRLKELPDRISKEIPSLIPLLSDCHLLTRSERDVKLSKECLERTETFLNEIEEYEILSKPKVPKFDCPDSISQKEYLTELCRIGWKRRFPKWASEEKKKIYVDRIKYELDVLQSCELDGYFLVVQDYINWAKRRMLVGPGRGSAGGSLVAYLLGITEVDPIQYNLLFERFYSADRAAGGSVSLPDVDTDFPKYRRHEVIEYIKNKYGKKRAAHIITFGTLKGAGALTEVLRSHDVFESKKIKSITKSIPQQDKVSDKLEEQKETSIIRFTLRNFPQVLKELGEWQDDKIVGEYSYYLEQAIRLEGCVRSRGMHASGILISNEDIEEVAPISINSDGDGVVELEMVAAEKSGLVKADILGLEALDRLMEARRLLLGESEDQ